MAARRAHALAPFRICGDVDELDRHADALGAALLMHQARAVGRDDVFGAGLRVVADLVVAHLGRHDLLEHREGAAEAAAFVRSRRRDELDPLDLREQIHGLGEERLVQLGRARVLQSAQGAAAVVQPDPVRKPRPGKRSTFRMSCRNSTSS